jgi:CheY-like chemotaxis protein
MQNIERIENCGRFTPVRSWRDDLETKRKNEPMAKLLLVEDNEMNRDMLSRRLERKGFTVVCAMDGQEGVHKARAEKPDLILMDMSLPIIDGWEATRQLKQDAETMTIPLIALTAHAMEGDERKAREAGCDDYDTKPVDLVRLLAKIEGLLERFSAR